MARLESFVVEIADEDLADLRERLHRVRWPDALPGDADWHRELRALVDRWRDEFDWRAVEAELNAHPQLITTIDGTRVHALHARSPEPDALPLVLLHGWPGSVVEFLDVIGPLTHGERPFHVVVPSLPGYGFSGPTPDAGWTIERMADAVAELMRRLGYERYGAQGGDWGSDVALALGRRRPGSVAGVHVNMLTAAPGESAVAERYERDLSGYGIVQAQRPASLMYAFTDSPVGQLAWIAERFRDWVDPATPVAVDRVLADVSVYWLTRTAGSAAALYREEELHGTLATCHEVPVGVAVAPHDIERETRDRAEQRLRITRWTELERGGHFAALEVPDLLVQDVRAFFATTT